MYRLRTPGSSQASDLVANLGKERSGEKVDRSQTFDRSMTQREFAQATARHNEIQLEMRKGVALVEKLTQSIEEVSQREGRMSLAALTLIGARDALAEQVKAVSDEFKVWMDPESEQSENRASTVLSRSGNPTAIASRNSAKSLVKSELN